MLKYTIRKALTVELEALRFLTFAASKYGWEGILNGE